MSRTVVVTRHQALIQHLLEIGLITADTPIISHAKAENVAGNHVIGVLPLSLAGLARTVTEVPMALEVEDRGVELSIERVREVAGTPVTYRVQSIEQADCWDQEVFSSGLSGVPFGYAWPE